MEISGEFADLIEVAATPAIIKGCVKGIEKEGKAEFKAFGKKHTLSLGKFRQFLKKGQIMLMVVDMADEPSKLPETRPPKSSHDPEPTSSACNKRARGCKRTITVTEAKQPITTERKLCCDVYGIAPDANVAPDPNPGVTRTCNGAKWPQACQHYRSVIDYHQDFVEEHERGYNPLTCPTYSRSNYRQGGKGEQIVVDWTLQHNDNW